MAQPYMSEIQIFSFPFAPKDWALCNGQTLPISTNQPLFSLLGNTFGGDGITTFKLPDLRGRAPVAYGKSSTGTIYTWGQAGGEETHSLTMQEMPAHNHVMQGTSANADQDIATGNMLASNATAPLFTDSQDGTMMSQNLLAATGMSQGHPNIQPYQVLNFCIALKGMFPSIN